MIGPKAKFTLQRKTDVSDGMGGYTSTWADVYVLKGTLTIVERNEKFLSDSTRVKSTHYFMTKYKSELNITEVDRLVYGSEIYEITFVDDISKKNRFWEISLRKIQ